MKAIKFAEPWKVDCVDQAMPEPKEGEALIKIHCAAVCGSDIGAFRGTNGLVSYPRVIGHELSGEIVSIPSDPAQNPKGRKWATAWLWTPISTAATAMPAPLAGPTAAPA